MISRVWEFRRSNTCWNEHLKILALDTSQLQATAVLIKDGAIFRAQTGSTSVSHSESLMKIVDEVLAGENVNDLDAFAIGIGPGSFTGIRIGCATIKALAQVCAKPVIVFSSLRATALSAPSAISSAESVAFVNAYQGMVFVGYADQAGKWCEDAVIPTEWCARKFVERPVFSGSGSKAFRSVVEKAFGARATSASVVEFISAEGIVRAVEESSKDENMTKTYLEVEAHYLRASQAEINLANK